MNPSTKPSHSPQKGLSNLDSDHPTENNEGVKQPLLEKNSGKKKPQGKIDKKEWLRCDKENCIEDFLFFGMSRVKRLVNLPEVGRDDYLKIRTKDRNANITADFQKHYLGRQKQGKQSFSGAYFSYVTIHPLPC